MWHSCRWLRLVTSSLNVNTPSVSGRAFPRAILDSSDLCFRCCLSRSCPRFAVVIRIMPPGCVALQFAPLWQTWRGITTSLRYSYIWWKVSSFRLMVVNSMKLNIEFSSYYKRNYADNTKFPESRIGKGSTCYISGINHHSVSTSSTNNPSEELRNSDDMAKWWRGKD